MDEAVLLHPLRWLEQDGEVVIGRTDADSYGVFPADGAELLRRLAEGATGAEAQRWYRERYGEDVDLDAFVSVLSELGFIRDPGDVADDATGLLWGQRAGQILFSPPVAVAWLILVLATAVICFHRPALLPRRSHLFWSPSLVAVELTLVGAQFPLTAIHEMAHVLAARRIGVRTRIRVSHRMFIPVIETILDGLVAVPKRQRVLPLLAGMAADVTNICVLTLVGAAYWGDKGVRGTIGALALAVAFAAVPKLLWQFYFFLRTDIYYLIVLTVGCVDLRTTSRQWLRNRLGRIVGLPPVVDESLWHPRDRATVRWYGPLMCVGYVVAMTVVATAIAPVVWDLLRSAVDVLASPESASAGRFWDALGLVAINLSGICVGIGIAVRERRHRRVPAPAG
jgi:hypothetical protein